MDKFSKYYSQMDKSLTQPSYPNNRAIISVTSTSQEMSDYVMRNVTEIVDTKIKELTTLAESVKSHSTK